MRIVEDILNWTRKKACLQLHLPHVETWLTLEFFDEHGNLLKTRRQRSKSWLRNAYNIALQTMSGNPHTGGYGAGVMSWRDLGGIARSETPATSNNIEIAVLAGVGMTSYGIVIGIGDKAEDFNDHTMNSLLPHDYGATNTVTYQPHSSWTRTGTTTIISSHHRLINNNSDGSIDIKEVGLRWQFYTSVYPAYFRQGQLVRDVLDPPETFMDKAQCRVTYSCSLTYPS